MNRSRLKRLLSGSFIISLLVVAFVFVPELFAQVPAGDLAQVGATGVPTTDIRIIIARLIRVVIGLLGIVLLSLIVYAGIKYMLARGDKEKVKEAWGIIRNALIGLTIVLTSYAITTFILNALLRAAGVGRNVITTSTAFIEPLSGSLGVGIIQDHYPPRSGADIPRNTKIIVTFKEPMVLDSLLQPGSYDPSAPLVTGLLNDDNVKIYEQSAGIAGALESAQVTVAVTGDLKTFVFDPVNLIGSPLEFQNYSVFLSPAIQKLLPDLVTPAPAFPPPFAEGYLWSFQVSTVVDITPPQVQSFIPSPSTEYARNILVQVNFNEPIDPTSASGVNQPTVNPSLDFDNLQVRNEDNSSIPVEGTYVISNGYKTVEFITFDQCGVNACGGDIFCLPGETDFTLFARAASLGAEPPQAVFGSSGYDGVVDVAGNSMDGGGQYASNKDLIADGPPAVVDNLEIDNFWSDFSTDNSLNTDRPHIDTLVPVMNQPDVNVNQDVEITFTEPMRMSSLNNTFLGLVPRPVHEMWYRVIGENVIDPDTDVVTGSTAIIEHGLFRDYEEGDPLGQNYYPIINNEVTTAYQICFYPAYGPGNVPDTLDCGVDSSEPSCCFGDESSAAACTLPAPISVP